uniref:Guanylate cyclase n=1 Tax=Panagrellus redivivus TaxID=6233 RepID=A0A7E4V423_PANRE
MRILWISWFIVTELVSLAKAVDIKIGVVSTAAKESQTMEIALSDILSHGNYKPVINYSFAYRDTCSNPAEGINAASELHFIENSTILIGPNCASDISSVTRLAEMWSLPTVTYAAASTDLSVINSNIVSSISPTTDNTLDDVLVVITKNFKVSVVVVIYNSDVIEIPPRVTSLTQKMRQKNVEVRSFELPTDTPTNEQFQRNVDTDFISTNARVIIMLMGNDLEENAETLKLLNTYGITSQKYAIFLPWTFEGASKEYPWIVTDPYNSSFSYFNETVKHAFLGSYIIGSDRKETNVTTRFYNALSEHGLTFSSHVRAYQYYIVYDSLLLITKVLNDTYTLLPPTAPFNASWFKEKMPRYPFEGATGMIIMDRNMTRIPTYGIDLVISGEGNDTTQVGKVIPEASVNDTYKFVVTFQPEAMESIESMVTEPVCGFSGHKCNFSQWYFISGGICLIIIAGGVAYWVRKHGFSLRGSSNKVATLSWRVPLEKVEIVKHDLHTDKSESELSATSAFLRMADGETAIVFNNFVKIRRFKQCKPINFDSTESQFLLTLKQLVHDNINPIVGLCYNNPTNELLVLSKYCTRGTLSDYLHNSEMRIDGRFKTAFLRDIINGLDYLHNAPLGYHGNLTTSNCVIDANFIVKLVAVGMEDLIDDWKAKGLIKDLDADDSEPINNNNNNLMNNNKEVSGGSKSISLNDDLLYRAPEFLRRLPPVRPKLIRMSKNEQLRIKIMCRMGDIYSLGILFFEVLFRTPPFADRNMTLEALVTKIRYPSRDIIRPNIPKTLGKEHHPSMIQMMQSCWSEDPLSRPPLKRVRKLFSTVYKVKGGLVDSIIQMMDQHANSLEKQVRDRTRLLEEAQLRADRLLAQMIPKDIARDLKLGRPVIPRGFASSSVLFTDIVSFTTICSQSTPMEIVSFLNDLFTGYDAIISQTDAYKVETIGDAYMVVSGVPNENGTENVYVIGTIALKMRIYLSEYKLPHMPDHKMNARWGLHTGPVAAGVVGLIAPRYCLFGDTVNVASRMESTGEPGRIQTSLEFHAAVQSRKDPFIMEKRGTITVKGKGDCLTYWLNDAIMVQDEESH